MIAITGKLEESIAAILARIKREARFNNALSAHVRVGIFAIASAVIMVGSAIALFLSVMRKVFFNLLIGWKGLQLGGLGTMFDKFIGIAEQLTGALHIPFYLVKYLLFPFVVIYKVAELVNVNAFYNLLTVVCEGAKSPIELFIDSSVLGAAILFIKSNYNFLWAMTFQEMNKLSVVKYWIEGEKIYSRNFIMAVLALMLTATNPFITMLRFFLSFVNIGAFFVNNRVTHSLSKACVGIEGFQNQELLLVNSTSVLVWWLIAPMLYSTAEIVCPRGGFTTTRTTIFPFCNGRATTASVTPLPAQERIDIDDNGSSSIGSVVVSDLDESDSGIGSVEVSDFDISSSGFGHVLVSEYNNSDPSTIFGENTSENNREALCYETFSILIGNPSSYDFDGSLNDRNRSIADDNFSDLGSVYDSVASVSTNLSQEVGDRNSERHEPQLSPCSNRPASITNPNTEEKEMCDTVILSVPRLTNLALNGFCRYFWSYTSLPISADLVVVYVITSYVNRYQKLHSLQLQRQLRSHRRWERHTIEQSVQLYRTIRLQKTGVLRKYELYFRKYESSARETDDRLLIKWTESIDESGSDKLPPFYRLCFMVQRELCTYIRVVYTLRPVSVPLSYLIAFSGVGHLLTVVGRKYWYIVARKYQLFFGACLGIWFDETYEAYEVEDLVREFTIGNPDEATMLFIPLIIASRVILLQALGDVTTFISIIVINICVAPLFVFSPKLRAKIPPLLYLNPREVALERELNELLGRHDRHPSALESVRVEEWVLLLRSLSILLTESRLMVFLLNLVSLSLTIVLLKGIELSTGTLALLLLGMLPYYVGSTLIPIMYIGKRLNLTDEELVDVLFGWLIRIHRFMQPGLAFIWHQFERVRLRCLYL
jgi:hypothetical protein